MRGLIKSADPDIVEELKMAQAVQPAGRPGMVHNGMVCTGEIYRDKLKLTFARGAALDDPSHLFNASLGGRTRRAIDLREGNAIDEEVLRRMYAVVDLYLNRSTNLI